MTGSSRRDFLTSAAVTAAGGLAAGTISALYDLNSLTPKVMEYVSVIG